jgi:hypothetical protein
LTPTAVFASARAELIIVERSAEPIYTGPRQTGTKPGATHQFHDHRCEVKGEKSIEFVRSRMRAPDGPQIWELEASDAVDVPELLSELATADVDRVREILADEKKSSNREIIVTTCQAILARTGVSESKPGRQPEKVVSA